MEWRKIKEILLRNRSRLCKGAQKQPFHGQHHKDDDCSSRCVQGSFFMLLFVQWRLFCEGTTQLDQHDRQDHCADVLHFEITHPGIAERHITSGVSTGKEILDQAQKQLSVRQDQQYQGGCVVCFYIMFFPHPARPGAEDHPKDGDDDEVTIVRVESVNYCMHIDRLNYGGKIV